MSIEYAEKLKNKSKATIEAVCILKVTNQKGGILINLQQGVKLILNGMDEIRPLPSDILKILEKPD